LILVILVKIITVIPVIFMFDKIRNWYTRRKEKQGKTSKRNTRAVELFKKYGVIGSALLGPLLTGTHIAAFIGMSMGATKKRMMNRSEEHTSELQSRGHLVCRLLLEKKKK